MLWLFTGEPEELEFPQVSKSRMDLSLIYPVDPKPLPGELVGVEWSPETRRAPVMTTAKRILGRRAI